MTKCFGSGVSDESIFFGFFGFVFFGFGFGLGVSDESIFFVFFGFGFFSFADQMHCERGCPEDMYCDRCFLADKWQMRFFGGGFYGGGVSIYIYTYISKGRVIKR